jgi:antitoxin YefM
VDCDRWFVLRVLSLLNLVCSINWQINKEKKMFYNKLINLNKTFMIMETIMINQAQLDLPKLIADINQKHQPILIKETTGNAVLISEQEWNEIQETLYIQSISGLVESIHQAAATPLEDCISVENIEW